MAAVTFWTLPDFWWWAVAIFLIGNSYRAAYNSCANLAVCYCDHVSWVILITRWQWVQTAATVSTVQEVLNTTGLVAGCMQMTLVMLSVLAALVRADGWLLAAVWVIAA